MGGTLNIVISGERQHQIKGVDFDFTFGGDLENNKRLRGFVNKVTKAAELAFEEHVPKRSGKALKATTSSVPEKVEGGWEGSAGIEPIHSEVELDKQMYPIYFTQGTGLWGPGGGNIYKVPPGSVNFKRRKSGQFAKGGKRPDVFFFEKNGERVFTTYFKGQPPKLVLEHARDDPKFNSVVRIAKRELGSNLTKLIDIDIR